MSTKLKIVPFWRPMLYRKAEKVVSHQDVRELIEDMKMVVKKDNGVGLAAPQVGKSLRVIVVTDGERGFCGYINPVIKRRSTQKIIVKEGCLSLSGVWCEVERAEGVIIKAQDENGKKVEVEARGMMAVIFQHEIDHLDGRLFISSFDFKTKAKLLFRHVFCKEKQPE